MHAQPDQAEPSTAQQSHPLEVLREAFAELGVLIGGEVGPDVEGGFLSVLIVELDGFLLLVLALGGGRALLDALGVLLLLPIK